MLLSFLTIVRAIAGTGVVVFAVLGGYFQELMYLYIAGGCAAALLTLQVIHVMEAGKVICPMCRSQLMSAQRCARHRQAKKLFGSYRLRLAVQVVLTNAFTCQFCGGRYQWRGRKKERE
ncbi:MAG: hypothetical protein ACPG32_01240 [Akkermansiaceae bacterium]